MRSATTATVAPHSDPARTDPRYWKNRLIRRRYTEAIQTVGTPEYSTRIEHEGISFFFPLGSDAEDRAAAKAAQIYSTIANQGWKAAYRRFPREITMAVFWGWNPMVCTYTTLYSMPSQSRRPAPAHAAARRSCHVLVIEPENEVRRALAYWIDRQPGFHCLQNFSTVHQAVRLLPRDSVHLVLVNRELIERPGGETMETLKEVAPNRAVFSFGIYEESNYIFHSVTGVPAGYFLRRQPPAHLFDPISQLASEPKISPRLLLRQIEKYFQRLFDLGGHIEKEQELANLTDREHEILVCLSKGFSDKQIAGALKISVWTVHGHVKKVFEKLGVHSRTEALIKFLQK